MPKRDSTYMENQRAKIADNALKCMLENGLYGPTTRDLCKAAGVSMGAMYNHFPTRETLVMEAFDRVQRDVAQRTKLTCWADYMQFCRSVLTSVMNGEHLPLLSLSYEFFARTMRAPSTYLSSAYEEQYEWVKDALSKMKQAGEVQLPLGLEPTVVAHLTIQTGAIHQIAVYKPKIPDLVEQTIQLLCLTAGVKA